MANPSNLPAAGVPAYQRVHDVKYNTKSLAAGALPAVLDFFSGAPNSNAAIDSYEAASNLVVGNKVFQAMALSAVITAGAGSTLADLEAVINSGVVEFTTANKMVGRIPLNRIPAAGGLAALSGQVTSAPGAGATLTATPGLTNGIPWNKPLMLAVPLDIPGNQQFLARIYFDSSKVLTGAVNVRLQLEGVEVRPGA